MLVLCALGVCSIRLLPHQQDTGGFFVAVIVKTEDFKAKQKRLKEESEVKGLYSTYGSVLI